MSEPFIPKINLNERMETSKLNSTSFITPLRMKSVEQPETSDFKTVFSGLVENLNNQIEAPDQILSDAMMGHADVHDVMSAISKAEIQVSLATTVVGKVIQAYEKISQINI